MMLVVRNERLLLESCGNSYLLKRNVLVSKLNKSSLNIPYIHLVIFQLAKSYVESKTYIKTALNTNITPTIKNKSTVFTNRHDVCKM